MAILVLIIPLIFGGTFYAGNKDFFDTASRQMEEEHDWHYVGSTEADGELPALLIHADGYEPYILWQLKKAQ